MSVGDDRCVLLPCFVRRRRRRSRSVTCPWHPRVHALSPQDSHGEVGENSSWISTILDNTEWKCPERSGFTCFWSSSSATKVSLLETRGCSWGWYWTLRRFNWHSTWRSRVIHQKIDQFAKIESDLYCYLSRDVLTASHRFVASILAEMDKQPPHPCLWFSFQRSVWYWRNRRSRITWTQESESTRYLIATWTFRTRPRFPTSFNGIVT